VRDAPPQSGRGLDVAGVRAIDHGTRVLPDGRTVAEWALLYVTPESNPSRFPTTPGKRSLSLSLSLSFSLFHPCSLSRPRGAHYCPLGDARATTRDLSPRVFYWLLPATVAGRHTVVCARVEISGPRGYRPEISPHEGTRSRCPSVRDVSTACDTYSTGILSGSRNVRFFLEVQVTCRQPGTALRFK